MRTRPDNRSIVSGLIDEKSCQMIAKENNVNVNYIRGIRKMIKQFTKSVPDRPTQILSKYKYFTREQIDAVKKILDESETCPSAHEIYKTLGLTGPLLNLKRLIEKLK